MASPEPVVLTGAHGYLGHWLRAVLERRGIRYETAGRRPQDDLLFDLGDDASLDAAFESRVVLHAGAMASMAACRADPDAAMRANAGATARLAERAERVVLVSTDLVFSGLAAPYSAGDATDPISAYGRSKAAAEEAALAGDGGRRNAVVRVPLLFGKSFDGRRGATDMLRASAVEGTALTLFENEYRTPLHVGLAADALVMVLQHQDAVGVMQVAGNERLSRVELAERFLSVAEDAEPGPWTPGISDDPERPQDVSLESDLEVQADLDAELARS